MNKSIVNWYKELNSPEREQALANCDKSKLTNEVHALYQAINDGFTWSSTPEGSDYWSNLYYKVHDNQYEFKKEGVNNNYDLF